MPPLRPELEFEHLGLQHLTELGVALRAQARGSNSLEDVAKLIVDALFERFHLAPVSPLSLLRLYLTRSLDELPPALRWLVGQDFRTRI